MNQATTTEAHPLAVAKPAAPSLRELLEDGVYLLFLLKDGNAPSSAAEFNRRVDHFLAQFEKNSRNFGKEVAGIGEAKYAFCALMDEIILSSEFSLREEWERMPLQLRIFGEHLAGEGFFDRLEVLRRDPNNNFEPMEVFHTCLLLGFQGKYLLEGQEIQQVRGGKAEFAPNWKLPQRFQAFVRHELPLWLYFALLALVGAGLFITYRLLLAQEISKVLG
jgi:type VI secretion system protein ImpK